VTISVGAQAPDFALRDQHNRLVRLSHFRGHANVLLVFYPWAFSAVCTGELHAIRDDLPAFQNDNVQVLGLSVDSVFAQRCFGDREGLNFPLLSDFWPHGAVARAYGVFDEEVGVAVRGSFILDRAGVVRWHVLQGIPDARDATEYRTVLAGL
jgi:peroxiredoxin